MSSINIAGTGVYLPGFIVSNDDFAKIVETSDEWITTRTGIKNRRIAAGETTCEMGLNAAKNALADAGVSPLDIDLILFTSVTPDYYSPSASCVVQGLLGAENAVCIDLNCACAGFVYALDMARRYIVCGDVKTVLIISSESLSKLTDYSDRSTCVLFGDGAAACVVKGSDGMFAPCLKADGTGAKSIVARALKPAETPFSENKTEPVDFDGFREPKEHYLYMDGREVYKFATKVMPAAVSEACEKAGISPEELDLIIPHQANIRIIQTAAKNLGLPMDKFFVNVDSYGNTSSASVPIALHEALEAGRIKKGDKICLVGFGAGLVAGAVTFEW